MTSEVFVRAVIIFIGLAAYGSMCKYVGYKKAYDRCVTVAQSTLDEKIEEVKMSTDKFLKDMDKIYAEKCDKCLITRMDEAFGVRKESKYVGDMQRD